MSLMKGARDCSKETILSANFSTGRSTRIMLMATFCFAAITWKGCCINSSHLLQVTQLIDKQQKKPFQCFSPVSSHKGHPESCPSAKVQECEDTRQSLYVHNVVQSVAVGRQAFLPVLNLKNNSLFLKHMIFNYQN